MREEKNNTDAYYLYKKFNLLTLLSALAIAGLVLTWVVGHYLK